MLLPESKHDLELAAVADDLEKALADRQPTLAEAEGAANSTTETIAAHLLDELARIKGAGASDGSLGDQHTPMPSADAIEAALQGKASKHFRDMAQQLEGCDLSTTEGQRDALSYGFNGKCVLAIRVLLSAAEKGDPVASRHQTLGILSDLRQHRRAYLVDMLRVDERSRLVPARMLRYEFSSVRMAGDQRNSVLFDALLKLDGAGVDWIAAPHGAMGWKQHQDGKALPVVHDKRDYFCQPSSPTCANS